MNVKQRAAALAAFCACLYAPLALAVYGQQVVIQSSDASAVQGQTISFATVSGQAVETDVETESRGRTVVNLTFDGDRIGGRSEAGTLTVGEGPDAVSISIPSAAAGDVIVVDLDDGVARTRPAPSPSGAPSSPGWTFGLGPYVADLTVPEIGGSGVVSEGGMETFILAGIDTVDMTGGSVSLARNLGGARNATISGSVDFGSGDDRLSASVPTMSTNTALVFTNFVEGITGIGIFPFGINSAIDTDVDTTQIRLGFQFDVRETAQSRLTAKFHVQYDQLEIEQDSTDTMTDPAFLGLDPSVTRNQELEQTAYELYAGLRYARNLSDRVSWFVEGGPIVRTLDADWTSIERILCAVCGPPLADVTVERRDRETGTSFGGQASLGLDFEVGNNASIEVEAFYRGGTDNAAPTNPQSGDDLAIRRLPSFLSTDTASEFGGRVRALFRF
ncbi:MAG: hypothetical protein AAF417_22080 [Pseudomonadota bacterium]